MAYHNTNQKYLRVAVLVETARATGREILAGIADYVRRHRPWIVYMYPHDIDSVPPAWLADWPCDGIIVRLSHDRILDAVRAKGKPMVDVLGIHHRGQWPLVDTDNAAIGRLAAEYFHSHGFVHYAFVGFDDEQWSLDRESAFAAAVQNLGGTCSSLNWSNRDEHRIIFSDRMKMIADWIHTLRFPAAIFACNDTCALILRNVLLQTGHVIGRDVALLGVGNDTSFCEMPTPSLSSIDANHRQVGFEAAAILESMMQGQPAPTQPVLVPPVEVKVRESTDFLAVPDDALRSAISFIQQYATEGINVTDVAKACFMSRSVVQRRFKKHLGQTVHDYILREKTSRAIKRIRETNDSIEQIAANTGFEYVQSLNKALRRLYGQSASAYRK